MHMLCIYVFYVCEHTHLDTYIRMQLCNGVCLLTYMCVVAVGIGTNVCAVFLHSYIHICMCGTWQHSWYRNYFAIVWLSLKQKYMTDYAINST